MFENKKLSLAVRQVVVASTVFAGASHAVMADDSRANLLEEVVVTASAGNKSQLESAISVSSVTADMVRDFQPSSETEVFRMIPGIQVSGTAGPGGNANIAVRGLAVATGGSPFVQIQEDGLPVVLFGDMNFGNNDYWIKFDDSVARVEGVRGGTSGTFTSQAPGAIINYISNFGEEDGGHVKLSTGVGYDETRIDFRQGGAASDSVNYHIGGYVKQGKGPLNAGFLVSDSVQIKGNVTKSFGDDNYVRFLVKFGDTQEPFHTGAPALANLSNNTVSNLRPYPGFDGRSQTNYSALNSNFLIVNSEGDLERVPVSGISTKTAAFGNEIHYQINDAITLDNKMRLTQMSGAFTMNFLSQNATSGYIGNTVNGGVVADVVYANGPMEGQSYTADYLNGNTNIRTNINDVGSFVNDLALSSDLDLSESINLNVRGGFFYMNQAIAQDWHPNKATSALSGDNPAMLDLVDADGNKLTANGIAGFNNNWGGGGCCNRDYDLDYTNTAPYLALTLDAEDFTLDASVREETVDASGWHRGGQETYTINVEGVDIEATSLAYGEIFEENLDYSVSYTSWTTGGLYKFNEDTSFFVRVSEGGRFNGDRQIGSGKIEADGSLNVVGRTSAVDFVNQFEIGIKNRGDIGEAFYTAELTLLSSDYAVSSYELTSTPQCPNGGCVIDKEYKSQGFEFFGSLAYGDLNVVGNMTYSDAEVKAPGGEWSMETSIPELMYTAQANYQVAESFVVGLNVTGQSGYNDNVVNWPDSITWGGFARWTPMENVEFGLQGYNLTDEFDLRGGGGFVSQNGANSVVSGGPVIGRTVNASVKVSF